MALKKKVEAPQFETDDFMAEDAVEAIEEEVQEVETPKAKADTKVKAKQVQTDNDNDSDNDTKEEKMTNQTQTQEATQTTAVATKPLNAVGSPLSKVSNPFEKHEWVFDVDSVRAFGPSAFPKVIADLGGLSIAGGDEIGKTLKVQVVSINPRWALTPNDQGDEASSLVRYSYDRETVENSELSVDDYLAYLKEEGYTKASIKDYADLWVEVVETHSDDVRGIAEGDIVHIQLSPQSLGQWKAFNAKARVAAMRGRDVSGDSVIVITQARRSFGTTNFGLMTFDLA